MIDKQMVMLSDSLEDQIVPGTLEFAIHTLVEERMNVSRFDEKYQNDDTGRAWPMIQKSF